jgi:hypothetical protein
MVVLVTTIHVFLFSTFREKQKLVEDQPEHVLGPAFGRIRGLTMTCEFFSVLSVGIRKRARKSKL